MVDRLKHSEINRQRIAKVEECFGSSGQPLADPERVLVGEGTLVKMCRKKPKARQFYLFNDLLVYGSIITKHRFHSQHVIPLEAVKLEDLPDRGEERHGWIVKTPTKSFRVYAATAGEKKEWMLQMQRCIRELIKEGRQPALEHAPAWVPDDKTKVCQCCQSTHFSVMTRRHHCRKCGLVVCGHCSQRTFILPHISDKPSRVCDTCYSRLCNGMNSPAGAAVAAAGSDGQPSPRRIVTLSGPVSVADISGESTDSEREEDESNEGEEGVHEAPTFYGDEVVSSSASSSANGRVDATQV